MYAMAEELLSIKLGADLTEEQRDHIAKKNFALTDKQSNTGKPAYPIHDEQHARSALGFVSMHGTDEQKAEVRRDIERKYPHLIKKATALTGMREELFKIATQGGLLQRVGGALKGEKGTHIAEIAGLGTLAALPADTLQAKLRSRKGEDWEHKSLFGGEAGHAVGDIAGLGILAAPSIAHLAGKH